jgi:hypothetical protein
MPSPLALAMMQQQPVAALPQASVNPTDVAQIYKNAQDAAVQAWKLAIVILVSLRPSRVLLR